MSCVPVNGTPSHNYGLQGVTCRTASHSVICHPTQVNTPALTPTRQAGTRFTGGMEG